MKQELNPSLQARHHSVIGEQKSCFTLHQISDAGSAWVRDLLFAFRQVDRSAWQHEHVPGAGQTHGS